MTLLVALAAMLVLAACGGGGGDRAGEAAPRDVAVAGAQGSDAATGQGISVTGRGEIRATPDSMDLQIGVRATRPTAAEATEAANRGARQIIDVLTDGGVDEADIQTVDLSLRPERRHVRDREPEITGFTFSNVVRATLRDLDAAGTLVDAAVAAGGDDAVLQGLSFRLDDDADAVRAAREAAVVDARERAEQLAAAAGVALGSPLAIEESAMGPGPVPLRADAPAAEGGVPIAPGEVTTTVVVSIRYAIA